MIKYKKAADGQIEGCVPEREYPGPGRWWKKFDQDLQWKKMPGCGKMEQTAAAKGRNATGNGRDDNFVFVKYKDRRCEGVFAKAFEKRRLERWS